MQYEWLRQGNTLPLFKNVKWNDQERSACPSGGLSAGRSYPDAGESTAQSAKQAIKGLNGRTRKRKAAGEQIF